MRKVILASSSPRRRELLAQAGIEFTVLVSDADENTKQTSPSLIVEELAERKARASAALMEEAAVIIGADTIVSMDGKIFGKPADGEAAKVMLAKLQGSVHQVYTGVALLLKGGGREECRVFSVKTDVSMYPMTTEEIEAYVSTGEPLDKAGAYGIQGRAGVFIKSINGDYNNVVGLPIAELYHRIKEFL